MSVDQDGCEWVSVSSGIGLPGTRVVLDQRSLKGCVCYTFFHELTYRSDPLTDFHA